MWRVFGRVRIAAIAIIAGVLLTPAFPGLAAPALAQSGAQRQGQPAATKTQSKAAAPTSAATADQLAFQAWSAGEAARAAREREERAALERRLVEWSETLSGHALGLTYAAVGLVVLTASLWLMAFLQSRDLKAAVRAVQAASAAAQASTEFSRRALLATQRATVIVGEPKAVWLRDPDGRLVGCRLLVTWHNVGSTPTKDMVAAVAGLATERPPTQTSALPRADARREPAIIGPNATISSASVNLPIGLVADILQHRAYYLFAGWAEYNDVFEGTPRHRVEFCYWLEFEGSLEAQKLEARFHIHGRHNRHCDTTDAAKDGVGVIGSETVAEPTKLKYGVSLSGSAAMPQPG